MDDKEKLANENGWYKKKKYDGVNMQKINEIIGVFDDEIVEDLVL